MRVAFYAPLKPPDHPTPSGDRRMARLLMEALRAGGHVPVLASRFRSRYATGARVQAIKARGEALAIALMMRGALDVPARTTALVTPDRALARRVATELARWNLLVDDSAGQPLATMPPATLLRLVADMAVSEAARRQRHKYLAKRKKCQQEPHVQRAVAHPQRQQRRCHAHGHHAGVQTNMANDQAR